MPTVLRVEGFEVVIRTDDHEPPHVHVFRSGKSIKVWLETVTDESNRMSRRDMARALRIVREHQSFLMAKWREIHG